MKHWLPMLVLIRRNGQNNFLDQIVSAGYNDLLERRYNLSDGSYYNGDEIIQKIKMFGLESYEEKCWVAELELLMSRPDFVRKYL